MGRKQQTSSGRMEAENAPNSTNLNEDVIGVPEDERTASTENLTSNGANSGGSQVRKSDCSSTWCTLPSVYALLVSNLVMVFMVFILPIICDSKSDSKDGHPVVGQKCLVEPFSLLIYSHTLYWFSHMIGDQYLKWHHRRGRLRGYLEFYIRTKNLRRTPFYIISFGNAILLLTVTAIHDKCDHSKDPSCQDKEAKIEALRGLITIECMIIAFMWLKYVMVVRKFKKDKSPPDLYRTEFRRQIIQLHRASGCDSANGPTYPTEIQDEVDIMNCNLSFWSTCVQDLVRNKITFGIL